MDEGYKEVYFHLFCPICKHSKKDNNEEPCDECLENPINLHTHKPVKWEGKGNDQG